MFLAVAAGQAALLSKDFESDTVGSAPVATSVRPTPATSTNSVLVVAGTAIGTGQGVRFADNSTNIASSLEYNFVASSNTQKSAISASFTYSQNSVGAANAGTATFALGAYSDTVGEATLKDALRRFCEVKLSSNGKLAVVFNTSTVTVGTYATGTVHSVAIYANDYDSQSVQYTVNSANYTLGANSVAYWVDGVMIKTAGGAEYGDLVLADITVGTNTIANSENNFGRFGLSSSQAQYALDLSVDNISINQIPEPAALGMLAFGAIAVLADRRRRLLQ